MTRSEFRRQLVEFFNKQGHTGLSGSCITEKILFGNWEGLRLSDYGVHLMKLEFDSYVFQTPHDVKLSVKQLTALNHELQSPYYLHSVKSNSSHILTLFNQNDYVHLQLIGDFKLWIASISC